MESGSGGVGWGGGDGDAVVAPWVITICTCPCISAGCEKQSLKNVESVERGCLHIMLLAAQVR